jgi:phosphoribosylformylglycinamidine cyclo-ligase
VFNCGIGLVVVVAPEHEQKALAAFTAGGVQGSRIGVVEPAKGEHRVQIERLEASWGG